MDDVTAMFHRSPALATGWCYCQWISSSIFGLKCTFHPQARVWLLWCRLCSASFWAMQLCLKHQSCCSIAWLNNSLLPGLLQPPLPSPDIPIQDIHSPVCLKAPLQSCKMCNSKKHTNNYYLPSAYCMSAMVKWLTQNQGVTRWQTQYTKTWLLT